VRQYHQEIHLARTQIDASTRYQVVRRRVDCVITNAADVDVELLKHKGYRNGALRVTFEAKDARSPVTKNGAHKLARRVEPVATQLADIFLLQGVQRDPTREVACRAGQFRADAKQALLDEIGKDHCHREFGADFARLDIKVLVIRERGLGLSGSLFPMSCSAAFLVNASRGP